MKSRALIATLVLSTLGLFITLALGLLVAPLAAEAQPAARVYRLGWLMPGSASDFAPRNELPRSKLRGINPPLAYSHGPASLAGWMLVYLVYVLHANLRTILTGRLGDAVAYSLLHCLAAEHTGE